VFDSEDIYAMVLLVDAIDEPVVAASGAVQALEFKPEWLADATRIGRREP
jgi:hypothetical protein